MVKKKIRATHRQKILAKKVIENMSKGAKKSMGKIIRESGYSESKSKHPKDVMEGKGFIAVLEAAGCTDDQIAKQLKRGLLKKGEGYYDYVIRDRAVGRLLVLKKHTNTFGDEAIDALKDFVQICLPPIDKKP